MASPFGLILMTPQQILDGVGANDVSMDSSLAAEIGVRVECFYATGPGGHVEWCYSSEGLLLSMLSGSATDDWASLEAVSVSPGFPSNAFELPGP
jgi:hypothetical protein